MSTALAIAGVTAVLRDRLNDWLVEQDVASLIGSAVTVSVARPRPGGARGRHRAQPAQPLSVPGHAEPGLGQPQPAGARPDRARFRLTNAPLGLDLHYLISAYSGSDLHAEILLGYAVQLLHEAPVLTREMIRTRAQPGAEPGAAAGAGALADSGLADQVEQLRITPQLPQHRRDLQALDRDAVELPADRGLRRLGGADRGRAPGAARACPCCRGARSTRRRAATAASS